MRKLSYQKLNVQLNVGQGATLHAWGAGLNEAYGFGLASLSGSSWTCYVNMYMSS